MRAWQSNYIKSQKQRSTHRASVELRCDHLVHLGLGLVGLFQLLIVRLDCSVQVVEFPLDPALLAIGQQRLRLLGPALALQLLWLRVGADHKEPLDLGGGLNAVVAAT